MLRETLRGVHTWTLLVLITFLSTRPLFFLESGDERLLGAGGTVLACVLLLLSATAPRFPERRAWISVAAHGLWICFFVWYGWFSSEAPFQMREPHWPAGYGARTSLGWPTPEALHAAWISHLIKAIPLCLLVLLLTSGIPAALFLLKRPFARLPIYGVPAWNRGMTLLVIANALVFLGAVEETARTGVGPFSMILTWTWACLLTYPILKGSRTAMGLALAQGVGFSLVMLVLQGISRI